jgi:hypothetical protein
LRSAAIPRPRCRRSATPDAVRRPRGSSHR